MEFGVFYHNEINKKVPILLFVLFFEPLVGQVLSKNVNASSQISIVLSGLMLEGALH